MRDEELARDARAGSSRAFEELVVRYEARLFRFGRRFGLSIEEAEDATQEALLSAWRSLDRYDPRRPLGPWLFTILARRAGGIARARESRLRLIGRIREREQEPQDHRTPRAARDADGLWTIALRELGPQASSALWLRYVEDMSPKEIARGDHRADGRTPTMR